MRRAAELLLSPCGGLLGALQLEELRAQSRLLGGGVGPGCKHEVGVPAIWLGQDGSDPFPTRPGDV